VFCTDQEVVGCCELNQYADDLAARITSLAADKSYLNQGN